MITANLADLERRVEAIVADANSLERVQILDETLIASTLLEASQLRRLIVEKRKGSMRKAKVVKLDEL